MTNGSASTAPAFGLRSEVWPNADVLPVVTEASELLSFDPELDHY